MHTPKAWALTLLLKYHTQPLVALGQPSQGCITHITGLERPPAAAHRRHSLLRCRLRPPAAALASKQQRRRRQHGRPLCSAGRAAGRQQGRNQGRVSQEGKGPPPRHVSLGQHEPAFASAVRRGGGPLLRVEVAPLESNPAHHPLFCEMPSITTACLALRAQTCPMPLPPAPCPTITSCAGTALRQRESRQPMMPPSRCSTRPTKH